MAEVQNNQNQKQNSANSLMSASSVPPPPAEVKVRTMTSDIDGIAQAGGGAPHFKTVSVEGMGLPKSRLGGGFSLATPHDPGASGGSGGFPWWIWAIIVGVFAILVFFGYMIFLKK